MKKSKSKPKSLVNPDKISNNGIDTIYDLLGNACFEVDKYKFGTPENKHGNQVISLFVELFGLELVQMMINELNNA